MFFSPGMHVIHPPRTQRPIVSTFFCQGAFLDQADKQTCAKCLTLWWGGRDPCLPAPPKSQEAGSQE